MTHDRNWIVIATGDNETSELRLLPADDREGRWDEALATDGLRDLCGSTSVIATWDDHDFVGNNTLGVDEPGRDVALRGFGEYWANPSVGAPGVPGVFTRATLGDIDWFLVDDRYHRGEVESMILLDYVAGRALRLPREETSTPALWERLRAAGAMEYTTVVLAGAPDLL